MAGSQNFREDRRKHLEFIQSVIARLARNSFFIKGWSVTLIAAILALTGRNANAFLMLVALLPALAFWGLDAFYVGQERNFRELHKDVVKGRAGDFLMDPSSYETKVKGWISSVWSRSVWPFHLPLVATVVIVTIVSRSQP